MIADINDFMWIDQIENVMFFTEFHWGVNRVVASVYWLMRKVRTPKDRVLANSEALEGDGKRHRKHTTSGFSRKGWESEVRAHWHSLWSGWSASPTRSKTKQSGLNF